MMLLLALACSSSVSTSGPVDTTPEAIGEAECAVCGMVVGEQPSPRAQLLRRDGSHEHVCSIEELRALAQQPTSKGHFVAAYVEALPDSFDVSQVDTSILPWVSVEDAFFVYGSERRGVMGKPVLSFDNRSLAEKHATTLGTQVLQWSSLLDTPFQTVPVGTVSP